MYLCKLEMVQELHTSSYCSEDTELPSLSFRPLYLPREFGQLFGTIMYIHPRTNARDT